MLAVGVLVPWSNTNVAAQTRTPNECVKDGKAVGQCMQIDLATNKVIDTHYLNVSGGDCVDQFDNDRSLLDLNLGGAENCPTYGADDER